MLSQSPATRSAVPISVFLAVALLSGAVLGFEVALSRVFATVLRYQFAFLVVSLALCGLGLGGLWAHVKPRTSLENAALGWGVAVPFSLALILRGVFVYSPQNYWIAALLVLAPFCFAGAFLSLAFGRFQSEGGRLYAFDLAGAALAAALSVGLMQLVGALQAALLFGVLGALAGVLMAQKRAFPVAICAMLALLVPLNARLGWWNVPPIPPDFQVSDAERARAALEGREPQPASLADRGVTQPLFTEIGAQQQLARQQLARGDKTSGPQTRILDTRWNAFARTDVVSDPEAGGDSLLLYTNGNVPTNMLRWSGQLWQLPALVSNFPVSDWTFGSANIQDRNVFSIGPGGGLDALLALRYGAARFDGAEINPSIVGLMNEDKPIRFRAPNGDFATLQGGYRAWNGGIYQNPRVHVRTAEGRDAIRESKRKYRLVFSALTKTATAGQGAALLESFIYTREAFNDYLGALDDEGCLAIVGDATPLLGRLTATAVDHFKTLGQTEREAGTHIALAFDPQQRGPYSWVLLVKKTPFSPAQTARMMNGARAKELAPLWIPGRASSDEVFPFGSLLSGALTLKAFVDAGRVTSPAQPVALDLSPCPDDRPFVLDLGTSPLSLFESSPPLTGMLGGSILATLGLCALLSFSSRRGARSGARATPFAAISDAAPVALTPDAGETAPPVFSNEAASANQTARPVSVNEAASANQMASPALANGGASSAFPGEVANAAPGETPDEMATAPGANAATVSARPTAARAFDGRGPLLFLLLGVGFMLVEVPLIQKLVLPLGYPTLSLTVILFSILLGGGAGALFSQRFEGEGLRRHALVCALGVAIFTLAFALSGEALARALLALPIAPRCVVAALLLLPLGFVLGTPFPSGMRLFGQNERGVALAWALNGTASVAGSIGAAVLAKMFGFSFVLSLGALLYAFVAGVFALRGRRASG